MTTGIDTDSPAYRERLRIVAGELKSESDRTVAIIGGAWVEEGLSGMLQAAGCVSARPYIVEACHCGLRPSVLVRCDDRHSTLAQLGQRSDL